MNSNPEVLEIERTQRETRANLEAVRRSWYSWQAPWLLIAVVAVWIVAFFMPASFSAERWLRAALVVLTLIAVLLNQYYRERAWRRLVALEAPALLRKIAMKTDA